MHHRREATLSLSPPTQPSLTQQQAPPRRQCPYWSDHQLSAFPPHPHFNPGIHPSSHNQQPNRSHHSPQPSLDASFSRSQAPHPYDPVHSSIPHLNNNWYPGTQSYHWSPITLPHPRASLDAFYPYPSTSSNNGAGSAATPGNNSSGERPTPTSGPVQPPVVQNQQTPRHEPFTPFPIAWQQQSGGPVRFSHFASQMSAPNQNQHNAQQSNDPAPASSPPSRTEGSHGNGNHESSGIRLPALQSLPTVLPRPGQASQNQAQQASTGTDDAQLTRPSARLEPSASAIGPSSNDGSPAPLGRLYENFFRNQLRDQSLFGGPSHRTETPEAAGNVPQSDGANRGMAPSPPLDSSNVPPRRLINMRHRQTPRRGESSDYDSDEDSADERLSWQEAAATNAMLQRLDDPLSARGVSGFSQEEDHRVREYQLARGAMKKKNVASSHAIASLQSVTISDLPDDEKSECTYLPSLPVSCRPLISNLPIRRMHNLLQRLWRDEPGRNQRGTASASQVQTRLWRPLHQEVVRRGGHVPVLPGQGAIGIAGAGHKPGGTQRPDEEQGSSHAFSSIESGPYPGTADGTRLVGAPYF